AEFVHRRSGACRRGGGAPRAAASGPGVPADRRGLPAPAHDRHRVVLQPRPPAPGHAGAPRPAQAAPQQARPRRSHPAL
ncbi:MAG: hypothetical protein AVDCRST_MAG83-3759, partial [uncultured Arthrobacter sp.]